VRGAEVHTLYKMSEQDDICFDIGFIPAAWSYVALGHIHKPQSINDCEHIRYPGPLDRLNFGEITDERGVILVEIGPHGRVGSPQWLPLDASPMYDVEVRDPALIEAGLNDYPDRATALVRMTIHGTGGRSRAEFQQWALKLFPGVLDYRWVQANAEPGGERPSAKADYRETVREHLARELAGDPDAADVLALAETYLAQDAA